MLRRRHHYVTIIIFQFPEMTYIESRIRDSKQCRESVSSSSKSLMGESNVQPLTTVHACSYEECNKFHRLTNFEKMEEHQNPTSPMKNNILLLTIVLLFFWIITYAVLTQFDIL